LVANWPRCAVIADLQSIARSMKLPLGVVEWAAESNSAIQQITNLRYDLDGCNARESYLLTGVKARFTMAESL